MSKIADIYGVNGSGLASLRFAALSSHLKLKEEGTSLWEVVLWVQIHLSHLKTSGVSGPKARPPIVPSSFSLRCEERAAKRKEAILSEARREDKCQDLSFWKEDSRWEITWDRVRS
ncbi:unnamed protein product [Camellia sinensis]